MSTLATTAVPSATVRIFLVRTSSFVPCHALSAPTTRTGGAVVQAQVQREQLTDVRDARVVKSPTEQGRRGAVAHGLRLVDGEGQLRRLERPDLVHVAGEVLRREVAHLDLECGRCARVAPVVLD